MKTIYPRFVTPKGEALYAKVLTPDTKFDPDGVYKIDLFVDRDEAQDLINKLEVIRDDYLENSDIIKAVREKNPKARINVAEVYEEDEEGRAHFKFKQKAKITTKTGQTYDKKVAIFDSKVKPIKVEIGNGSTVKVSFSAQPYYMASTKTVGLSLKLIAVQVLNLVEFGQDDSAGFEAEEGYEANTEGNEFTATVESIDEDDF